MKQKTRILVVDDDPNLRKTLADILKIKGYEAVVAASGAVAIADAKREKFSLALIDLMLPDMSGLEVMARIKTISPLTEAIILTGHASMDTAIEAIEQGAFSYLLKPYQMDDLLLKIRHGVERQQAQSEIIYLTSFPRLNPNPVIEVSSSGEVSYTNPAADKLFPDLCLLDGQHPLFIGLGDICATLRQCEATERVREIGIGASIYEEHIYCVPESELVCITVLDVTERKQAEARLAEQLDELRRWHEVTSGREKRILELKHEVNELLKKTGQPPRYPSAET